MAKVTVADVDKKVAVIESNLTMYADLFRQLSESQAQIGDVLSELREMMSEQRTRIQHNEIEISNHTDALEIRRGENTKLMKDIRDELKTEITLNQKINCRQYETLKSEIKDINKWRWMLVGAGVLVGGIMTFVSKVFYVTPPIP